MNVLLNANAADLTSAKCQIQRNNKIAIRHGSNDRKCDNKV